jgi:hypothetical protein
VNPGLGFYSLWSAIKPILSRKTLTRIFMHSVASTTPIQSTSPTTMSTSNNDKKSLNSNKYNSNSNKLVEALGSSHVELMYGGTLMNGGYITNENIQIYYQEYFVLQE